MQPPLTDSICVRQTETGGKTVVSVLVQPGPSRPYGLIGKLAYAGGAFVREGTRTVEASLDSVMEMIRQGDPCSWEKRACGRRDLTFSEATAELETDSAGTLFAEAVRPDTGRHKAETPPSNLALLLSDQNPYGVILNTYDSAGRLTKSEKIPGSVLIQRRLVCTRLAEINRPLIDKETDDFVRRETFPWPPQALSAAVTLMLMHRDYASPLASAVCIHTDTIRFLTPGAFPPTSRWAKSFSKVRTTAATPDCPGSFAPSSVSGKTRRVWPASCTPTPAAHSSLGFVTSAVRC